MDDTTLVEGGLAAVVVFIVVREAFNFIRWRQSNNGRNGRPGKSSICMNHGERLAAAEATQEAINKQLVRIENKLDRVLVERDRQ